MNVQFIEENGARKFAVTPMADFERLIEELEMREDVRAFDEAQVSNSEYFPMELVSRLLDGENGVKVFREHHGMTVAELATAAGLDLAQVEAAEADVQTVPSPVLERLATALRLEVDDLTAASPES